MPENCPSAEAIRGPTTTLRTISAAEMKTILTDHQSWLKDPQRSEGQADLSAADLRGVDLHDECLRDANLRGSDLSDANLSGTILRDANLQKVLLTDAKGLLPGQFGGADLSQAQLPTDLPLVGDLDKVDELSKNAGKLFVSMLLACAYSWLTIGTTTDAQLIPNSSTSKLPLVDTAIPIVGFYWLAPVVLLGLYVYFHLYLQRLWEVMANLPAVFPDGQTLDKKTYPWLLNDLVRAHFKHLRNVRLPLFWLQERLSVLLGWWVVPVTLLLFWVRYLRCHDWTVTCVQVLVIAAAAGVGISFYGLAVATLRADDVVLSTWRKPFRNGAFYKRVAAAATAGCALLWISYGAVNSGPLDDVADPVGVPQKASGVLSPTWGAAPTVVRSFCRCLHLDPTADLMEAEVSTRPAGWKGSDDATVVKGANLARADLRWARARRAFLCRADLHKARLEDADLQNSFLREANIRGAQLMRAHFKYATLRGAELEGGDDLEPTNLQQTDFYNADLSGADLEGVHAQGADFQAASLIGTWLKGADLTKADLRRAVCQDQTRPNPKVTANFDNAVLKGAHLEGADLRQAKGLTLTQLAAATGNDATKLPDYLKLQLPQDGRAIENVSWLCRAVGLKPKTGQGPEHPRSSP